MTENRVLELLHDWSQWMHSYAEKLGYPSKSLMLQGGGVEFGQGHEIMCESMDEQICFAVDAAIDSINKLQRQAINARYLHSTKPSDYERLLRLGVDNVAILLEKKHII
jgi:hypothetical protein